MSIQVSQIHTFFVTKNSNVKCQVIVIALKITESLDIFRFSRFDIWRGFSSSIKNYIIILVSTVNILQIAQFPWESSQLIYRQIKKNGSSCNHNQFCKYTQLYTKPVSISSCLNDSKRKENIKSNQVSPLFQPNLVSGIWVLKVVYR